MERCCICGKEMLSNFGNNPNPIKEKGQCCDRCNLKVVIPARLKLIRERVKNNDKSSRDR